MSGDEKELASPVCYAGDSDPAYMGYASADELAAFLNAMLTAEREIVCRLQNMLPRIRDDGLHAALRGMLESHERAIARLSAALT
jgi:hypothetical protein